MTTKVKIELVQEHLPVIVEIVSPDGRVGPYHVLRKIGQSHEEYVHSGQSLRVREQTTEEFHMEGLKSK